ncbi:Proteasome component Ecm, partial [Parasponia andersonii]
MAEPASSSSSSLTGKSDGEIEEMLDRMLTRLALCDDPKLQPLLSKLLPITISSLSSHSSAVRNKVLEILSHLNKRVKHQPEIGLPLLELWNIYSEANAAPMVRNFCIVYIEMAFERVPTEEKVTLAPMLLVNVSKLPLQHQEIILRIVVKVIGDCHSSRIDDEVVAKYRAVSDSQDRELFIDFCLHTILYQPTSQRFGTMDIVRVVCKTIDLSSFRRNFCYDESLKGLVHLCSRQCSPGLSISQTNRVSGKQSLDRNMVLTRKLGVLNVIENMELAPELVYPLYLAASVDFQDPVIKRGEELLRKKANGTNLDDVNLMNKLFLLFN